MRLTARKVKQGKTTFYETAIPADELVDEKAFVVDRWTPEGGTGYQRELNLPHIRNIANYLKGEENTNVMPTSMVLNSRRPLKVNDNGNGTVEINLEDKDFPLFITDGQHRRAAIKLATTQGVELDDYEVGVTLTHFPLEEEIAHFRKINTSANKAPKSLDQQLTSRLSTEFGMNATSEQRNESRAVEIITRLATDPESPWFDKIALGGQRKKLSHTTVQSAMVRSLKPLFQRGRFSNPDEDKNEVYKTLYDFWNAVKSQFPEAFETTGKYNIQRATGINTWHDILGRILNVNLHPTEEQMAKAIESMKIRAHITDAFWEIRRGKARTTTSQYGSKQAWLLLADEIWYNIDKATLRGE